MAPVVREVTALHAGVVVRCDAQAIGELVRDLGGGRQTKADTIDPAVGVDQLAKPGEELTAGAVLALCIRGKKPAPKPPWCACGNRS